MRLLILGGTGLLGHAIWRRARQRGAEAVAAVRAVPSSIPPAAFPREPIISGFDARTPRGLAALLDEVRPAVVLNCIGITKALVSVMEERDVRDVNTEFPHRLASEAAARDLRVIHVSTDCVFSGAGGGYRETDVPDPIDLYGRSKLDGEPSGPHVLTIRTSMVGRELTRATGLLEWFLSNRGGRVSGFAEVRFSGLATPVLADWLIDEAYRQPGLRGLYHVAGPPIDKYTLLGLVNRAFDAGVAIDRVDEPRLDRTLDGTRFREATGCVAPPWPAMIDRLAADEPAYSARGKDV